MSDEVNCLDSNKEVDIFLDKMLESDKDNKFALYGKSLILFQQGKIEESSETLHKAVETDKKAVKLDVLRKKLTALLEAKHEVKVEVLPELRKKFSDLKNTEVSWKFLKTFSLLSCF